jgi:nitrite reductase/ring-hydroxylating ferredoxin subunit
MCGEPIDAILVPREGDVYGYVNRCLHTGAPFNWMPDAFLSLDGAHIQCATHDALFTIADGRCITGPCPGSRLTPPVLAPISHRRP